MTVKLRRERKQKPPEVVVEAEFWCGQCRRWNAYQILPGGGRRWVGSGYGMPFQFEITSDVTPREGRPA